MKLAVASDIHLDHCPEPKAEIGACLTAGADALLICGDISTGKRFREHMREFLAGASCPVYFVLGNHDHWGSSPQRIAGIAKGVADPHRYLQGADPVWLTPDTALVGVNGWYSMTWGPVDRTRIVLNDVNFIPGLHGWDWDRQKVVSTCRAWSNYSARMLRRAVMSATNNHAKRVIVGTHFPCSPWAIFPDKGHSDDRDWWPWSVNGALGDQLEVLASCNPDVTFDVFTGHTHGQGEYSASRNLHYYANAAEYGYPKVARMIDV